MPPRPDRKAPNWPATARGQALALLTAVLENRTPLDAALRDAPALRRLEPRDRAFARLLATAVLRRLPQLDRIIDAEMSRPLPAKQLRVRNVLRLGVVQLVFLDTPPHAAVDGSVDLARNAGMGGMRGLINAVLRKIAGGDRAAQTQLAQPGENTPDWLWQSWRDTYGAETAAAIATQHLVEPPLDLTVNPMIVSDVPALAAKVGAEVLPTGSLRRTGGGAVGDIAGFTDGKWWVQDAAAALPARLAGDVAGRTAIDLCAAPGGKTAQLAAAGAQVTAIDISEARLATLRDNLVRLGLTARTVAADAASWRPNEAVDLILLDAPCSATGTMRRHPDIAWLKGARDVAATVAMQDRLLAAALDMVKPGGVLIYAVCSLQPEEGAARIDKLLGDGAPAKRDPIGASELPGIGGLAPSAITPEGDLRTLPCHLADKGGMDGFYVARLRRD